MKTRFGLIATLAVALIVGTSCASSIEGHPQPGLTPVDLDSLTTGGHEKEPTAFELRTLDSTRNVQFIEARRILNVLVHPFDVDSDLTHLGYVRLMADSFSMTVDGAFPKEYGPVADKLGLIAGAYSSRTNGSLRSSKKLIISVLRFPTDTAAKNAADEFDRITREQRERHTIPIDGYPDAHATSADGLTAISFQPHGPYVVITNAGLPEPGEARLADILKKAIGMQITQLDKQQPIPLDDLLDLPIDPGGIMRRAAPKAKDYSDPFMSLFEEDFGVFEPSGFLHFLRNPIEVRQQFERSGVDLVGNRAGTVYRSRDLAAAIQLQTALTRPGKDDQIMDPPPGLIDARCLKLDLPDPNRSYTSLCAVVYNRYVAVVISSTPQLSRVDRPLQERAAAQYSILVKSE
ncbi:DUF7373 family lipoprotein [Nocardia xishanensis]|uniref:DUF7373 family lipoprotein n=1 Tax=Nocardia xishanensis TaxID=238964 RepID=UPI00083796F5|nr:hypothetical protein [Nocardia xishanensis]